MQEVPVPPSAAIADRYVIERELGSGGMATVYRAIASRLSMAGVLIATAGLPEPAPAQYQLPTLVSSVKADSLHEAAVALEAGDRFLDAARLHRRSAEVRPGEDPLGFRCLTEAAALAYFSGDPSRARTDMAEAAGLAESPLLGASDRATILRRIRRVPESMRMAMRREP